MGEKSLQNITKRKQVEETLKEAEKKYRTLFTSISDAAYLIDQETGRILEVNKAAEEMYGYTRKEWLSMKNTDVSAEPDKTQKATEELPPTIPIHYHKKKDGTVFPIEMTVGSFMLNGCRLIIATGRDITERKKTDEEILKIKNFYQDILGGVITGVWVTNKNDVIFYANKGMGIIAGIKPEKIEGARVLKDFPESTLKFFRPYYLKAKKTLKPVYYDAIFVVTHPGRQSYQSGWLIPQVVDSKFNGIICTVEDVTDREKAKEEKERLSKAIEITKEAINITAPDGTIFYTNDAMDKLFGYRKGRLIGKNISCVNAGPRPKSIVIEVAESLKTRGFWSGEVQNKRKDGSEFTSHAIVTAHKDKNGKIMNYVCAQHDITEKKEVEEELVKYRNHLENLVEERTAELSKTNEKLDSIINSASEIIIAFDRNKRVVTWNKTVELLTGYKQREVIGKPLTKLDVFDDSKAMIDAIKSVYDKTSFSDRTTLRTKKGGKRIISVSGSTIKGDGGRPNGCLFIGRDITSDIEVHGRLLKGNSYLIPDKTNKSALELFINLTVSNQKGLCITRGKPEMVKSMFPSTDIKIVLLSKDKVDGFENISDFDEITAVIKDVSTKNKDSVILLDRVDYFITRFSFEQFIESLYQINNIVSKNDSILLLHLNPSIVDTRQFAIIRDELQLLPSQKIEDIEIEDELYNILEFIYEQNQKNAIVSFKKIGKEFSIVSRTTSKRLRALEDKGLIYIKKRGRSKTLHVSEKGKTLLNRRGAI